MQYLYEMPLWLVAALILLGVVLFWTGNNRRERRLMQVGVATAGLGIVLAVLGEYLESDREQVVRKSYEAVAAVEQRDWNKLRGVLDDDVQLAVLKGADSVVRTAEVAVKASDLRSARIVSIDAKETTPSYTVTMQVFSEMAHGNGLTNWQLIWEKGPGGWVLVEAEPLGGPGVSASMVESYLRARMR